MDLLLHKKLFIHLIWIHLKKNYRNFNIIQKENHKTNFINYYNYVVFDYTKMIQEEIDADLAHFDPIEDVASTFELYVFWATQAKGFYLFINNYRGSKKNIKHLNQKVTKPLKRWKIIHYRTQEDGIMHDFEHDYGRKWTLLFGRGWLRYWIEMPLISALNKCIIIEEEKKQVYYGDSSLSYFWERWGVEYWYSGMPWSNKRKREEESDLDF